MNTPEKDPDPLAGFRQGQLGFSLALAVALDLALCIWAGVWADGKFGPRPLWTLVGVVAGLATAGVTVYGLTRRLATKRKPGPKA